MTQESVTCVHLRLFLGIRTTSAGGTAAPRPDAGSGSPRIIQVGDGARQLEDKRIGVRGKEYLIDNGVIKEKNRRVNFLCLAVLIAG